ncbi:MAG: 50S ribosomal protein L19e [Candidatus Pacearchaeota archaeon]
MDLRKKKELAARTLGVGKDRIIFVDSRLEDIKEAITRRDIRDLYKDGAIIIKERRGRRKIMRKKRRRGIGSIKKKIKNRKEEYVKLTRKLRGYVSQLKKKNEISRENVEEIRKRIKNRYFKNLSHLKEFIKNLRK